MNKKALVHIHKCTITQLLKNAFESVLMRWMKLVPIIQSEVSQTEKHQYSILMHICGIQKKGNQRFFKSHSWKQPRCPSADEWIRKLWYIYTMKYYPAIKKNIFESVLMRWMKLEPIIQSEVSQKEKHQYSILTHIYVIQKDGNDNPICKTAKETQMYRTVFWTLWERERVG